MHDLRFALRALRATPIATAVAVLSLALGIGANTAMFSLVDSLILRNLPVSEPQRLAIVSDERAIKGGFSETWTYSVWDQIRQRAQPIADDSAAWLSERFNLAETGGETQLVDGIYATGDYFATLGVPPLLGRALTPDDDVKGGGKDGPVAVISYALWQRRFGGSGHVVGGRLTVDRVPFTVVGVMPPSFFGAEVGRAIDIALPMNTEPLILGKDSRIAPERVFYALTVLLRLKRDQTLESATRLLRGVQPQIREAAMPTSLPPLAQKEFLKDPFTVLGAASGTSRLRARYDRPLIAIFIVVALVLAVACANIANLQLARAAARRHELAVRVALGASRWRLVRQWLLESLLVSALGAALGLLFAAWSSRSLVAQLSTSINRVYLDMALDWRVLGFTAGLAVATAILFGTLPALRGGGVAPIDAMNEQGRGAVGDARIGLSSGLVVAQVALSLVIVVAAGLFVRTFEKLATQSLGFDGDRLLLVNVSLARSHVNPPDRLAVVERLVRELKAVPGVAGAAASPITPIQGLGIVDIVHIPGQPLSLVPMTNGRLGDHSTFMNAVTPEWFAAYGTPIAAGRAFDDHDVKGAPAVIIVNDAFVRKFMKGKPPIGAQVAFERGRGAPVMSTVVGVVHDAPYNSLRNGGVPIEYVPFSQNDFPGPGADVALSVRSAGQAPASLARGIATALTTVNQDLVFSFRPMSDQIDASLSQERVTAAISGFFGALALLLAGLGLYGITAYAVARRRMEIGIRMALGSTPSNVVRLVVSRGAWMVALGILIGAGIGLWAAQFVASLVYGLEPRDPITFYGAAAVLVAVAGLASAVPAWRASRIDPAEVLRES